MEDKYHVPCLTHILNNIIVQFIRYLDNERGGLDKFQIYKRIRKSYIYRKNNKISGKYNFRITHTRFISICYESHNILQNQITTKIGNERLLILSSLIKPFHTIMKKVDSTTRAGH